MQGAIYFFYPKPETALIPVDRDAEIDQSSEARRIGGQKNISRLQIVPQGVGENDTVVMPILAMEQYMMPHAGIPLGAEDTALNCRACRLIVFMP